MPPDQQPRGSSDEEQTLTLTFPTLLLFWVWMIWTGVVAWRRTPKMSLSRTPD